MATMTTACSKTKRLYGVYQYLPSSVEDTRNTLFYWTPTNFE
uniref:Ribulose bisphosphate carboxylase small chain n=1 Tax=Heterorhabditis bacteriophora TaxID=37862 RepID=A0A1I7X6Q3_HETBA